MPTYLLQIAVFAYLTAKSRQSKAIIDNFSPLTPMADYVPPNDLDNDPNYYYPADYRILNCWDCFAAEGKVCIDQGHNSLFHHTGSSDPGNAFCCKPDADTGYCENGAIHDHSGVENQITTICSEPSVGAS